MCVVEKNSAIIPLTQTHFDGKASDVLVLQAELARAIAAEIQVKLSPNEAARFSAAPKVDPAAHEHYLKGRYYFNRPSDEYLQKAITEFDASVRISPTAAGYSGLSDSYLWAGYNEGLMTATAARPKAKAAAEMAVQLDSNSVEAHASLATFKMFYEFDWAGSEKEFRRAIAINPNYGFAHDQYGMALSFQGRYDEAIEQGMKAISLDPLSPQILVDATLAHMFKGDFTRARQLAKSAGELDPTYFFPVMLEGWVSIGEKKPSEGIPNLENAAAMSAPPFVRAYLGLAYGQAGDKKNALAQMDSLKKMGPVLPFNQALIYMGIGDNKQAIDNLELALKSDSQMMAWVGHDKIFNSLREEPRFIAILKQMHFVNQ